MSSTAIKSADTEVKSAGSIISIGDSLPCSLLSIATVVGIRVTADALRTTKRTISLDAVLSAASVSSLRRDIASSPNGVAALPSPKRFAVMFIDIAFIAGESFLSLGNKSRSTGESARLMILVSPDFSATFIIPLQKVMIPISFKHSSTAG